MKFTVTWNDAAESDLANAWMAASTEDRSRITDAAGRAESLLRFDPQLAGESRSEDERIVFLPPLVFSIKIREPDRIVEILSVHHMPRSV
jgi:hypothetical protein